MSKLTIEEIEATLRQEVRKLDKRVQLQAVVEAGNEDAYRVTFVKDGRTGSADILKGVVRAFVTGEAKGKELRKALGRAVSHLSIRRK